MPRLAVPELRSLPFSLYPPPAGSAATEALSARLKSQRQIDTARAATRRLRRSDPAVGPCTASVAATRSRLSALLRHQRPTDWKPTKIPAALANGAYHDRRPDDAAQPASDARVRGPAPGHADDTGPPIDMQSWFDAMAAAHDSVRAYRTRAKADSTRAAYRSAICAWCAWCHTYGVAALPATNHDVAAFLATERDHGKAGNTLKLRSTAPPGSPPPPIRPRCQR